MICKLDKWGDAHEYISIYVSSNQGKSGMMWSLLVKIWTEELTTGQVAIKYVKHRNKFMILTYFTANNIQIFRYLLVESYNSF